MKILSEIMYPIFNKCGFLRDISWILEARTKLDIFSYNFEELMTRIITSEIELPSFNNWRSSGIFAGFFAINLYAPPGSTCPNHECISGCTIIYTFMCFFPEVSHFYGRMWAIAQWVEIIFSVAFFFFVTAKIILKKIDKLFNQKRVS